MEIEVRSWFSADMEISLKFRLFASDRVRAILNDVLSDGGHQLPLLPGAIAPARPADSGNRAQYSRNTRRVRRDIRD
jgi:hypothetical protein